MSGRYPQHGNTGKHAAIYLEQDASGIQVMNQ
ncbi:BPSL0067 family protein [Paraburkholderia youngii]